MQYFNHKNMVHIIKHNNAWIQPRIIVIIPLRFTTEFPQWFVVVSGLRIWFGFSLLVLDVSLSLQRTRRRLSANQMLRYSHVSLRAHTALTHRRHLNPPSLSVMENTTETDKPSTDSAVKPPSCIIHESCVHHRQPGITPEVYYCVGQSVLVAQNHRNTSVMWSEIITLIQPHSLLIKICLNNTKTKSLLSEMIK